MEALIVGDTHGNWIFMNAMIEIASTNHYSHIIQVGDFGWWPTKGNNTFVRLVDNEARQLNICLWAIDGNHDFPGADEGDLRGYRAWRYTQENLHEPGLHWIPRNTLFEIDDKRVAFIGGAVSVDRIYQAPQGTWFPEEMITEIDVADAQALGPVDVLISHTRRDIPPHFHKIRFDDQTMMYIHDEKIRWEQILSKLQPSVHIHGHFHSFYESHDEEIEGCHTIGLSAEDYSAFIGFDFETLQLVRPTLG